VKEVFAETVDGALWLSLETSYLESRSEAAEEWVAYLVGDRPYVLDDSAAEVDWVRRFSEQNALPFGIYQVGLTGGKLRPFRSPPEVGVLLGCIRLSTLDECATGFSAGWSGGLGVHVFQSEPDMCLQIQEWSDQVFHAGPTGGRSLYTIRVGFDGEQIRLLPNRYDLGTLSSLAANAAQVLGYNWRE